MELRRELVLAIGALVLLNALLAFGAIGLFVRMGPAIERILEENVASVVAAEEMVGEFAEASGRAASPEQSERIRAGLDRLARNLTEPDEQEILARAQALLPGALEGDADATAQEVDALRELIRVNRAAMLREDRRARRLGSAGAWGAVFVGLASFLGSLIVFRRFRRRFVEPLVDVYQVLEDVRGGDRFRRARPRSAPAELRQVRESVNALLDERLAPASNGDDVDPRTMRLALLERLSRADRPTVVTDRNGRVLVGNDAALEALSGESGDALRESILEAVDGDDDRGTLDAVQLPDGGGWICSWDPAADA